MKIRLLNNILRGASAKKSLFSTVSVLSMRTLGKLMRVSSTGTLRGTRMKKNLYAVATVLLVLSLSILASAYDWTVTSAHVTVIQAPVVGPFTNFDFIIDQPAGPCAAGSWIFFNGSGPDSASIQESVKMVYATLLAAQLSGHTVTLYGFNPDSSGFCHVQYVHINTP